MIELYYWPTPNGHKITMFLEEAELPYRIHPVDISAGDRFKPNFLRISPNNRMPAIIDPEPTDRGKPISVFRAAPSLRSARPQDGARMALLASGRAWPDGGAEPSLRAESSVPTSVSISVCSVGRGADRRRLRALGIGPAASPGSVR